MNYLHDADLRVMAMREPPNTYGVLQLQNEYISDNGHRRSLIYCFAEIFQPSCAKGLASNTHPYPIIIPSRHGSYSHFSIPNPPLQTIKGTKYLASLLVSITIEQMAIG